MILAFGVVKNGKLFIRFRRQFDFDIAKLNGEVEIKISKGKRSLSQNAYLFGVILPLICAKTGYAVREQEKIFEALYAPVEVKKWRGREIVVRKTCSQFDKNEFSEFIERIRAEAGELGVIIPEPVKNLSTDEMKLKKESEV